ncbi:cyclic peptide export ABC transporter [Pantoea ananatis]|uniref:cyclic peptide export ABC transporter n=1 Tax=Pantoea ananas TaxID=553 RepID=UPI0024ACC95A|nr:cyclic peptide export ABC transporter [Pantoea ananatis]MDI6539125.1 cyclic peptide export ABC transporter [Pantoea ananatis]
MKNKSEIKFTAMKQYLLIGVLKPQCRKILLSAAFGALSAICNLTLLSKISDFFNRNSDYYTVFLSFIFLLAGCISGFLSEYFINLVAERTAVSLREDFCERVLQTPLLYVEKVGGTTLYNIVQADISVIQAWTRTMPYLISDIITITGAIIWLSFISLYSSLILLTFLFFGVSAYLIFSKFSEQYYTRSFLSNNEFFKKVNEVISGVKELKISRFRAKHFKINRFTPSAQNSLNANMKTLNLMAIVNQWGRLLFFLLILVIYFTQSNFQVDRGVFATFAMMIIFLMGPVSSVLSTLVDIASVRSSLKRILSFNEVSDTTFISSELKTETVPFNTITLNEVTFSYDYCANSSYSIGPISVEFKEGELNFIIGGNGSGKSTFLKVLSGLYIPVSGTILYSNSIQGPTAMNPYDTDSVSAIFQDFHLFEDLPFWNEESNYSNYAVELIDILGLGDKVSILNGSFNTLLLSYGQKKRLALIQSILEDRKVYIFDEWAADQDPVYKEIFYKKILPDLVKRRKIVIITTHDDKYFHCADHLFKFDYGLITKEEDRPEAFT